MLLGIDVGTSGTKAVLVTNEGVFISDAYSPYDTISKKPYHVEQDANVWWDALKTVVPECLSRAPAGERVDAVCLSSQAGTMVPVDERCVPLTNAVTWQDSRCERERLELLNDHGEDFFYKKTGWKLGNCYNMIQIFWMKRNIPDLFDKTFKFLGPSDFLIYRLTGDYAVDVSDAGQRQLINVMKKDWDDDILDVIGIGRNKLSRVVRTGETVWEITDTAAAELGLNDGAILVAGSQDQYCAAVGINAIHKGDTMLSTGTGWDLLGFTDKIIHDTGSYLSFTNHIADGLYATHAYTPAGGSALKWYRNNMGEKYISPDGSVLPESYAEIDERAKRAPAGADGLIFLPHFLGTLYPTWSTKSKGVLCGLGFMHNRDHVARAVMEGVVYDVCLMLDGMRTAGCEIEVIKAYGGAAGSDFWMQLLADAGGVPIITPAASEAAGYGAAMIAGCATGAFSGYDEAYNAFDIKEKHYKTDTAMHKEYRRFFENYKSVFQSMKKEFDNS